MTATSIQHITFAFNSHWHRLRPCYIRSSRFQHCFACRVKRRQIDIGATTHRGQVHRQRLHALVLLRSPKWSAFANTHTIRGADSPVHGGGPPHRPRLGDSGGGAADMEQRLFLCCRVCLSDEVISSKSLTSNHSPSPYYLHTNLPRATTKNPDTMADTTYTLNNGTKIPAIGYGRKRPAGLERNISSQSRRHLASRARRSRRRRLPRPQGGLPPD